MTVKHIFGGLLVAILASIAWRFGALQGMQDWLHPSPAPQANIQFDKLEPPRAGINLDSPPSNQGTRLVGGMRKCKRGNDVIYTDGDCPAGSKEVNIKGGSVTVVPGQAAATKTTDSQARPSNVRTLLTDPQKDAELRDRMMDKVINR